VNSKQLKDSIIIFILLILNIIIFVKANPLPSPGISDFGNNYLSKFLPISFFLTYNVEFGIICFFLKGNILKYSKVYKAIFTINFLTFPMTQLGAFIIMTNLNSSLGPFYFLIYYISIELLPICIEGVLLIGIFREFDLKNYSIYFGAKKTFLMSTIANLVTFSIGIILSFLIF
jgi:hypothetical protein